MNVILHLLSAAMLIAGMILLRMFADRCAPRTKIRVSDTGSECEQAGCFRGCDRDAGAPDNDSVARHDT